MSEDSSPSPFKPPVESTRLRAFISYARADAKEFVEKLNTDLKMRSISCWLDTENMHSGGTFIAAITEAIERADYLILVNTPGAINSMYCRDEWEKALQAYKPIIPIVLIGDYSDLPEQANTHLYDARDFRNHDNEDAYTHQLQRLIEQLQVVPHRAGRLEGAPNLPTRYLERSNELTEVANILTLHKTTVMTATTKAAGIQGMGGIGKTVLATALTRDYFVRRNFKDGIFWLTFGTDPDIGSLWAKLRNWLGGGNVPFDSWEQARDYYQESTNDKECLIILDDVWEKEHTHAFTRFGDKTRLLITSRFRDVIESVDAQNYELGVLLDEQAMQLLAETAEVDIEHLPNIAEQLIKLCGNLPLAISMIGAMVRGRSEAYWEDALDALNEADLEDIAAQFPEYPYPNLFAAIQVSIDALDDETKQHYYDFAIFPDDVDIPEDVPITFWQPLKPRHVRRIVDDLVNRNLLNRDPDDGSLTLHDLQLSFIQRQVTDLVDRHNRFLKKYNPKKEAWHLVADQYLLQNLAHHLDIAERQNELFDTLTQSPDWMNAKFEAFLGDTSYVSDLEQLIAHYQNNSADHIHRLAQLWTTRSIVNTRTMAINNEMIEGMVLIDKHIEKTGQRVQQALGYVSLRPDAKERFDGLLIIYEHARSLLSHDNNLYHQLITTIDSIESASDKAYALQDLSKYLAQNGQFDQAHDIALSIVDNIHQKVWALSTIASHLAQSGQIDRAHDIALSIVDNIHQKVWALSTIASHLAEAGNPKAEQVFDQAYQVALATDDNDNFKARTLSTIASQLAKAGNPRAEQVLEQAYQVALSIDDNDNFKARTLSTIASQLAKAGNPRAEQVLEQAHQVALSIDDTRQKDWALDTIASHLAESGQIDQAHDIALSIDDTRQKGWTLSTIGSHLARSGQIDQAYDIALSIDDTHQKGWALGTIASDLARSGQIDQAYDIATAIDDNDTKARALGTIASHLAEAGNPRAEQVLEQAYQVALTSDDNEIKARALITLLSHLVQVDNHIILELVDEVNELALASDDTFQKNWSLSTIASCLAESGQIDRAHQIALSIDDTRQKGWALSTIAPHLARSGQIDRAHQIALSIDDHDTKATTLSAIAFHLTEAENPKAEHIFDRAHQIALAIDGHDTKATTLSTIAFHLAEAGNPRAEHVFDRAHQIALAIDDHDTKAATLSTIASCLAESGQIDRAHQIALYIDDTHHKGWALSTIASHLARSGQIDQAYDIATAIDDNDTKARALGTIASHLAEAGNPRADQVFDQAHQAALAIDHDFGFSTFTLRSLATDLAKSQKFQTGKGAFYLLGIQSNLEMFEAIINWKDGFEGVEQGLWYRVMRDVCRIISWTYPQYKEYEEMFTKLMQGGTRN